MAEIAIDHRQTRRLNLGDRDGIQLDDYIRGSKDVQHALDIVAGQTVPPNDDMIGKLCAHGLGRSAGGGERTRSFEQHRSQLRLKLHQNGRQHHQDHRHSKKRLVTRRAQSGRRQPHLAPDLMQDERELTDLGQGYSDAERDGRRVADQQHAGAGNRHLQNEHRARQG